MGVACVALSMAPAPQDDLYFLPTDRVSVRNMAAVPPIDVAPGVHVRTVVGPPRSFSVGDFESGSAAPLDHHTHEQTDVGIGVLDMTRSARCRAD
jgi:hypothetical protein